MFWLSSLSRQPQGREPGSGPPALNGPEASVGLSHVSFSRGQPARVLQGEMRLDRRSAQDSRAHHRCLLNACSSRAQALSRHHGAGEGVGGRACLCFLQSEGSPASPWPPKSRRAQAPPAPCTAALPPLKPAKLTPTSGPVPLWPLCPQSSSPGLLKAASSTQVSPQMSSPQTGHPVQPGLSRNPRPPTGSSH